ncbi:hypothetical protein K435DRAFT_964371 [Dendrothele bispora CBS 962.96]|uniref:Uncharacterized protein n=1 Tax=Dendrothele bispora (strain CBS 962.96) TaxID=1314807 RepID=A0A4S8MCF7_DENBC|nr:hypothetical protein K435DRAFT_964371 [Dendrothele bispora CBS 962.96]
MPSPVRRPLHRQALLSQTPISSRPLLGLRAEAAKTRKLGRTSDLFNDLDGILNSQLGETQWAINMGLETQSSESQSESSLIEVKFEESPDLLGKLYTFSPSPSPSRTKSLVDPKNPLSVHIPSDNEALIKPDIMSEDEALVEVKPDIPLPDTITSEDEVFVEVKLDIPLDNEALAEPDISISSGNSTVSNLWGSTTTGADVNMVLTHSEQEIVYKMRALGDQERIKAEIRLEDRIGVLQMQLYIKDDWNSTAG